ncbi:MAG TPA: hypothetical protein PKB06_10590, partial [Actinotalea sp.]|nr:hypothetical protein [Actinotalea sp.]
GGIGSALLLAARYVPPLARTAAWRAVFAILLAVVVVTLGVGVVRIEQLVVVLAVVVHALGVPALVASRVPVTAG